MIKFVFASYLFVLQMAPVTYTGIDYVKGTDSLKVTVRFNYDLFLRDYQQTVLDDISIDTLRTFRPFPQDLANYYLNSKISIMAGDRQVTGKLLSLGEDNTDIVFNMLFRINRRTRSITVRNTILTGLSSKTENLVIFTAPGIESTTKFTSDHTEQIFNLKQ